MGPGESLEHVRDRDQPPARAARARVRCGRRTGHRRDTSAAPKGARQLRRARRRRGRLSCMPAAGRDTWGGPTHLGVDGHPAVLVSERALRHHVERALGRRHVQHVVAHRHLLAGGHAVAGGGGETRPVWAKCEVVQGYQESSTSECRLPLGPTCCTLDACRLGRGTSAVRPPVEGQRPRRVPPLPLPHPRPAQGAAHGATFSNTASRSAPRTSIRLVCSRTSMPRSSTSSWIVAA